MYNNYYTKIVLLKINNNLVTEWSGVWICGVGLDKGLSILCQLVVVSVCVMWLGVMRSGLHQSVELSTVDNLAAFQWSLVACFYSSQFLQHITTFYHTPA